jgi:acyl-CoA synthetase (AMP-forming)/AMP-acid ligase II
MMLGHMQAGKLTFSTLKRTVIGGSACPPAMITAFNDDLRRGGAARLGHDRNVTAGHGVHAQEQALAWSDADKMKVRLKQGRGMYGVDMKIVDGEGQELPWDGKAYGDLLVKGPWIIDQYFKGEGGSPLVDGWFPTGDVATIDADGLHADHRPQQGRDQVRRRVDQLHRRRERGHGPPGGGHGGLHRHAPPEVGRAAHCGAVVRKPGAELTREELLAFYEGKIAKWQIPDDVVFVDAIPLGATGKMMKVKLREQLKDYTLPGV